MKAIRTIGLLALIAGAFAGGYIYKAASGGAPASAGKGGRKVLYWVDPMHPAYKSDKPGIAPDCGMQLVPKYAEDETTAKMPAGSVRIAPEKQQLIGVRTETVERQSLVRSVRDQLRSAMAFHPL